MRLWYFIGLQDQLAAITSFLTDNGGNLTFVRLATPSELVVTDNNSNLALAYTGDCRRMVISLDQVPNHNQDWDFFSRAKDQLIIVEGGRQEQNVLELSHMRIFAVSSTTKSTFGKLKRRILKKCTCRGLQTRSGFAFKNVYYDPSVVRYELREDLEDSSDDHVLIETSSGE
jgi:serine/threonine protein phosphatase PrpC